MNKKYFLKFGAITTIATPILAVISCGDNKSESQTPSPSQADNQAAFTVSLNQTNITKGADVGSSMQTTITPSPEANQTAIYKITTDAAGTNILTTDSTNTLSIDQTGKITGAYSGTETKLYVFVTIGSDSNSVQITVNPAPEVLVTDFNWNLSNNTFKSGVPISPVITTTLDTSSILPANATDKTISYKLTDNDSGLNPEREKNGVTINEADGTISGLYTSTTPDAIWAEATVGALKKYIKITITRPAITDFDLEYLNNTSIPKNTQVQGITPTIDSPIPATADTSSVSYAFTDSSGNSPTTTQDGLNINDATGIISGSYTGSDNSIWVTATIGIIKKTIEIALSNVAFTSFNVVLANPSIVSGSQIVAFNASINNIFPTNLANTNEPKIFKFTTNQQGQGQTNNFDGLLIDDSTGQISGTYLGSADSVFVQVISGGYTAYKELIIKHPEITDFNIVLNKAEITKGQDVSPLSVSLKQKQPPTATAVPEYTFTDSATDNDNPENTKNNLTIDPSTGVITGSYNGAQSQVFVQVSVPRANTGTPLIKHKSITVNPIPITGFDFTLTSTSITKGQALGSSITITPNTPQPATADISSPDYTYGFVDGDGASIGLTGTKDGLTINTSSGEISGTYNGVLTEIWIEAKATNKNGSEVKAYKSITVILKTAIVDTTSNISGLTNHNISGLTNHLTGSQSPYSVTLDSPNLSRMDLLDALKDLISGDGNDAVAPNFVAAWDNNKIYNKTINDIYKATISATGYEPVIINVEVTGNKPVPDIDTSPGITDVNDPVIIGANVTEYKFNYSIATDSAVKTDIESALKGFVQKNSTDPTPAVTFTGVWDGGDLDIATTGTYTYIVSNANYKPITFTVTVTA